MSELSSRSNGETLRHAQGKQFERLNILLVVSSYLPNVGGLQTVTSNLARGLREQGHEVTVLAQRYPRTLPEREVISDVPVERLLFLEPRWSQLAQGRIDLFAAGLVYFPLTLLRLIWRLRRGQYDIVNLHFCGDPALFLLLAHRLFHFPFIVSLHGDDVQGLRRRSAFDRRVFGATLREAEAVTACSQDLLNETPGIEGTTAGKARVIVNGVTLGDAAAEPAQDYMLGVGRLMPKKGFDVLLNALARLRDRGKTTRLVLIGDGPEREHLEKQAGELALENLVEFRGSQTHSAVWQALCRAKLAAVPSRLEPFGMAALEALAAGKPVVASRVGGLIDVLDGAEAELVPPDDAEALARAMETMLERIQADPLYGARNRERAKRFSTGKMVEGYTALYHAVRARG